MNIHPEWTSPDADFFWAVSGPVTEDYIRARIGANARVLEHDGTLIMLYYDRDTGEAWLNVYLAKKHRKPGFFKAAVDLAVRLARSDGMRKMIVQTSSGNPFVRTRGRMYGLGFEYAGRLRDHFKVRGEYHDCILYERFL